METRGGTGRLLCGPSTLSLGGPLAGAGCPSSPQGIQAGDQPFPSVLAFRQPTKTLKNEKGGAGPRQRG